jgi:hypothetical protein
MSIKPTNSVYDIPADWFGDDDNVSGESKSSHPLAPLIALPLSALVISIISRNEWFRLIQRSSVGMALHELGHAITAWFHGVLAMPLPLVTVMGQSRSELGYAIPMAFVALLAWRAWRTRLPVWLILALTVATGTAACTFVSERTRHLLIAASGVGGEFVLGTLLVTVALYKLSDKPSWNSGRLVLLTTGMLSLVPAWSRWNDVSRGLEPFPIGSAIGGENVGDMNELLAAGYSQPQLIAHYLQLGRWCLLFVVVNWVWRATQIKLRPE